MKIKQILYNLFLKSFLIIFIVIFLGTIFDNKSVLVAENPIYEITSFVIITIFFMIIYFIFLKKINDKTSLKKEIIIVSIIFIIFCSIQLVYAYFMTMYPGWDWGDVMEAAKTYVVGSKDSVNWSYFQMFPNTQETIHPRLL